MFSSGKGITVDADTSQATEQSSLARELEAERQKLEAERQKLEAERQKLEADSPSRPRTEQPKTEKEHKKDARHSSHHSAVVVPREVRGNLLVVQGGLLALSIVAWLVDGVFTVSAVANLIPSFWVGLGLGVCFHIFVSRAQLYLWPLWKDPVYLAVLILALAVNVGTSLFGLVIYFSEYLPFVLGGAPTNIWQWYQMFFTDVPWVPNVITLLIIATLLALLSEPAVKKFWNDFRRTWSS